MDHFYDPDFQTLHPLLNKSESHHCIRVLRHLTGDSIGIINGLGTIWKCTIEGTDAGRVQVKVQEETNLDPPVINSAIAIALPKSTDRVEFFIEKATELGVSELFPIYSSRSERKKLNPERIIKKAVSAMKQSGNPFLPVLHPVQSFDQLFPQLDDFPNRFIAHQSTSVKNPPENERNNIMLIGPEGGFTNEEISRAKTNGFVEVSLGTHILRTETAGILGLQFLMQRNLG